ncbi:cation:proton antiporter domain-containing protein [Mangrovibrevibacter kandeliae]|uniref:cation:proton antiporter domain-containing protein n=1 Tax=Mangrovibrevibacter kandeliae TaxID=2968473 RepID=UPI002119920D|nr:cation:proton antiporter [Aurantimonas sp. CSK15Z-1]MCQ8783589.1 cation:proton antiporter [Aurantimonas sp. CSK15Z-1]
MSMTAFHGFVFVAAATVWSLSLTSKAMKAYVAPPLVVLAIGLLYRLVVGRIAPQEALLHDLEVVAWFAVGFGVMSIALRLRSVDIRNLLPLGSVIVLVAMLAMWAVSTVVVMALFGLPLLTAAVIGAIVTPTDPVVASSIATGPFAEAHIPGRLRQMLSFESGANDGLGFPFLYLPILLLQQGAEGWRPWLLDVGLWKIVAAGVIAVALGYGAGRLAARARAAGQIGERSVMLASLTLTAALLGLMKLIAVDSVWAAFLAGLAFTSVLAGDVREASDEFQEGGNNLMMVPALLLFAMALPFDAWRDEWPVGLAAVLLILLLRRLPAIAALYAVLRAPAGAAPPSDEAQHRRGVDPRPFRAPRDFWFYGWFGPIGLSAIFYAATAHRELHDPRIFEIASMIALGSIVVHGLSAAPFTRWYARVARRKPNTHGPSSA